jgi:hypothetical protein
MIDMGHPPHLPRHNNNKPNAEAASARNFENRVKRQTVMALLHQGRSVLPEPHRLDMLYWDEGQGITGSDVRGFSESEKSRRPKNCDVWIWVDVSLNGDI